MSQQNQNTNPSFLSRADQQRLREFYDGDAFGALISDPMKWRDLAQRLRRSGDLLAAAHRRAFSDEGTVPNPASGGRIVTDEWKPVDLKIHVMAAMLYGYSLEVLAKGVVIKKRRFDPDHLTKMPKELVSHDVGELLRLSGVSLDNEELEIIPFLRDCVVWMGRYPAPTAGPVSRSKWLTGPAISSTAFVDVSKIVDRLYRKLCTEWDAV